MKMCPDGCLTKEIFIDFSRKLYGHHAKQLSVAIFDIFDEDLSGKIDFQKYLLVLTTKVVTVCSSSFHFTNRRPSTPAVR